MNIDKKPEPADEITDPFTTGIQKLYKADKIDVLKGKYRSIPELVEKHGKVLSSAEMDAIKKRFPTLFKD